MSAPGLLFDGPLASAIGAYEPYHEARKTALHKAATVALRALADRLGLPRGSYRLDTNKAGPAVAGETTLHTDTLYVQVSADRGAGCGAVMFRSVKGQKDYTGGPNRWASAAELEDTDGFIERLRRERLIGGGA